MQKCCTIPFSLDSGAKKSVPCPRSDIIKVLAESVVFLRFGDLVASAKSKLAKAHIKNTLQHVKCPTTSILKALVFSWPAEVRCCRHGLMLRWTALGPGICLSFPVFWCWSMAVLLENWFLIWGLWHACNPLGYSDYYRLLGLHEIPRPFQQVGQKDSRSKRCASEVAISEAPKAVNSAPFPWRSVQQTRRKCKKSQKVTWNVSQCVALFRLYRIDFTCQVHSHGCSDRELQLGGATQVQNRNTGCALEHISQPDYFAELCRRPA